MKTIRLKANEIIYNQGDKAERFYLIKQGTVGLTTQIDLTTYRRTPIVSSCLFFNIKKGN